MPVFARALRLLLPCCVALQLSTVSPARAEDAAEPQAMQQPASGGQRLQLELGAAEAERASMSRLWPIVTLSAGVSAVVVGTVFGAAKAASCDGDCGTLPWVSAAVVIGAAVGTAGAVWLLLTNRDMRELDSKIERLRRDIERSEHSSLLRREQVLAPRPLLHVRISF